MVFLRRPFLEIRVSSMTFQLSTDVLPASRRYYNFDIVFSVGEERSEIMQNWFKLAKKPLNTS